MSFIFHDMVKIYEVLETAKIECISIDNKLKSEKCRCFINDD